MKFVALLLVMVNLALTGWLYTHREDYRPASDARTVPLAAGIEELMLLSERTLPETAVSAPIQAREASPAVTRPRGTASPGNGYPQETVPADAGQAAPDEQAVEPSSTQPMEASTTESAAPGTIDAPLSSAIPQVSICQIIGPFASRTNVVAVMRELTAVGVEVMQRTSQMEQPSGYWVYLPTMPKVEAKRIADELAAKGVKDYFLGRQNFISLGVFSDKRTAEERMREIGGLGYEPRLEPRFQTHDVYWLDLEERTPNFISEDRWESLLRSQEGVRRQPVACE